MIKLTWITLALALAPLAQAAPQTWEIDPAHSVVAFKVRHMMVSWVHGHFSNLTGTVAVDDKDLKTMKVEAKVDAKTINTDNAKRDEHLRSPDFFNTETNPTMTFTAKKVTGKPTSFKVTGDLTLNGKTKEVTFDGKDLTKPQKGFQGEMRRGFTATAKVNRKDFGIIWNKTLDGGGIAVGDDVDVTVDVEMASKTETKS